MAAKIVNRKSDLDIIFLPMQADHLSEVISIEKDSFPTPWSRYAFYGELLNDFAFYIVAVCGDKVVGYAGMWLIIDEAHITNLAVRPDYRRRGIGRSLMQELENQAVTLGAKSMTLEVRPSNDIAKGLYSSLGFFQEGRRRGYYSDTGEDALIMWKHF
jgi:ribosomal-protein-alanine N-acetyltransferase